MDQMEEGQFMCCGVVEPSLVTELWTAHNADIAARCWSSCVLYSVQLAIHFLLDQLVIQCMAKRFDFQIATMQEDYNY